ncbi:MAG TPA: nodulation protein NfeD [Thermodesulfobacteriota bacterium]|nr:nodulation protein NfeD [Thermodesulfobacteriota bacterium]
MREKIPVFMLTFAILLSALVLCSTSSYSAEKGKVILIEIDGTINPATDDYIRRGIQETEEKSAEALVIILDTPGGLLSSTQKIVKSILNAPVPVVVYVSPSGATATSAGVFITLSAHVAAMAEGTSIGAAHPVLIGGGEPPGGGDKKENGDDEQSKFNEKVENFASSFIESIAQKRGRNTKWAIEAVRNSASITASEALEKNVIDLISPSLTDLLNTIDGRTVNLPKGEAALHTKGAEVQSLEMNFKQKLVDILSDPNIAFLLLSLGSLGLFIELYNPGLIFPGVAGAISFLLGLVSLQILPFNYAGLALLGLSVLLLIAEIYVTSFGILGVGGIIAFILGALLLFDTPESDVRVGFNVVISAALAIGLFFLFVAYYLVRAQSSHVHTGYEGLMEEQGTATTDIEKVGKVFINGEYWDAESDETIRKGDKVKVVEVKPNLKLKVKKA